MQPLGEQQRQRQQHRGRVGDAEAGEILRRGRARHEEPRPFVREPRVGDARRRASEVGGSVGQRLEELRLGDDHVEVALRLAQADERLADGAALDEHAAPARVLGVDDATPRGRRADRRQPAVLRRGAEERALDGLAGRRGLDGAEDDHLAGLAEVHARDAPHEIEVGHQRLDRRLVRARDEDRVGLAVRRARRERQRMTEARHRLARERHVHFVDRERMQLVETREHARRLGHQLRPDAGAGEARDLLRMVHVHAATSSNTSARETRSPPSASPLKRANAESTCSRSSSSPAAVHARANA